MKVTFLKEIPTTRGTMEAFGGYDHRARIAEGNFFDECNLSTRDYPVMATRRKRIRLADIEGLQGVLVKDSVAWVANNKLYYDGTEVPDLTLDEGEKTLISMGARIIIYPDMIGYDTVTGECERLFSAEGDRETFQIRIINADQLKEAKRYTALPDGQPLMEVKYSEWVEGEDGKAVEETWTEWEIDTTYVPVEGSTAYAEGDESTIYRYTNGEWVLLSELEIDQIIFEYRHSEYRVLIAKYFELKAIEGSIWLWSGLERFFCEILKVEESAEGYSSGTEWVRVYLKSDRPVRVGDFEGSTWFLDYPRTPILDGMIENSNRLWGWRRGEAMNGEFVNEIYATALGDPKAWNTFDGLASDSFAATVGSDGPFTGAAYFSGCMYFFKETCFHRVMGNKPANYQITTFSCHGVEEGSERSLVVVGDAMYYKGVDGIYCYDGSVPYKISDAFGDKKYKNAVGGVLGDRIFFDMEDDTGARSVFVYDTAKKLWHVEDSIGAKQFVPAYGNLIAMTEGGLVLVSDEVVDDTLTRLFGESMAREGAFSWFGEFGDFGLSDPDAKYVSKLLLRMTVDEGARMTVEVMCDSDGSWRTAAVVSAKNKKSWCLPVVTPRCDHFRLRLSGVGGFKLWTLTREIESTNEVRR